MKCEYCKKKVERGDQYIVEGVILCEECFDLLGNIFFK